MPQYKGGGGNATTWLMLVHDKGRNLPVIVSANSKAEALKQFGMVKNATIHGPFSTHAAASKYAAQHFKVQAVSSQSFFSSLDKFLSSSGGNVGKAISQVFDNLTKMVQAPGNALAGAFSGNWINSLGGMIGSGIEGGLTATLSDFWLAISGPIQIMLGATIAFFTIMVYLGTSRTGVSIIGAAAGGKI